jgi:hypothetical protein|tara:strand:- start:1123 stop:1716 length:594 start_codon:yes stop_codon:yes gene_type:complete
MSFRKEKKFKLTYGDMALMQKILKKKGMQELYPSRTVNSCYFDNNEMMSFNDSEEGVLPRKKVRIRWYNRLIDFKKETKISSIEGRFKFTEDVPEVNKLEDILDTKYFDPIYGMLIPKLIISYRRYYFTLNKLRITFDKNIIYKHILSQFKKIINDEECVMEIKTPIECHDDYIENIVPHQISRFSKYSRGLLYFNI